jgi:hypothetical protein
MGRWAFYRGISPRLLDRVIAQPRLVLGLLALGRESPALRRARFEKTLSALPEARREEALLGLSRLESLRHLDCFAQDRDREGWGLDVLRSEGFSGADMTAEVNIEKRWQWLHDRLERVPRAPRYAVMGGTELGEDLGSGPLRCLAPADVAVAAVDLASLSLDDLRRALPPDDNDTLAAQWAWETFQIVRDCYVDAASKGYGVLLRFG